MGGEQMKFEQSSCIHEIEEKWQKNDDAIGSFFSVG